MSKESNWLEKVKGMVAEKQTLQEPNVTLGSSDERKWWPPYLITSEPQKHD